MKPSSAIGLLVFCIICTLLLLRELVWRYDDALDLLWSSEIRNTSGHTVRVLIRQTSSTSVDTTRRRFSDMKNGITNVAVWFDGINDTLRFSIRGRYYSEMRLMHISTDSSTQIYLVPNTEHGMPTGWGELIYCSSDSTMAHTTIVSPNVSDFDKDGTLEIYDPVTNEYSQLDTRTGSWVPVPLHRTLR